jgi:hypothetical protein
MEGVFCVSRAHRIVHDSSEGRCGGWTVRRTLRDVVRDADGEIGRGGWTGNGCQGHAVAGAGASSAPDYVALQGRPVKGSFAHVDWTDAKGLNKWELKPWSRRRNQANSGDPGRGY